MPKAARLRGDLFVRRACRVGVCILAIAALSRDARAQTSIAFVQINAATPQSASTAVSVTYTSAQTAGNLNIVVVGWNDASAHVQTVTDTRGNVYAIAVGPTVRTGVATQSIYYAKNIIAAAAGANTVRVAFDRSASYADVRIAEYRGLDTAAPLDVTAAATGSGTTTDSGAATTTSANALIVGANLVLTHTTGPGAGFTSRMITNPDGDILEDRIVTSNGSYNATAPISPSAEWIMQMVAFKAAGSGSPTDPPPPPPPTGPVAFPLKLSASHRYLVDQNDAPFPILGRTAWFAISVPAADYQLFIDDSVSRGYNAIEMHVLDHDGRGFHPPLDGNNDAPFLKRLDGMTWNGVLGGTAPDFTTPNDAYWTFVEGFLNYCASKGVVVFMFPAYTGFQGGSQGWMQEMTANGTAKMNAYGAWIANRYKNQGNIVWMAGGDYGYGQYPYTSAQRDVEAAMLNGMHSVSGQQSIFFSAEWVRNSIATDQADFGSQMTLNGVYSNSQNINSLGQRAYSRTPVEPAFLLEEPYDQEGSDGNGWNSDATQPVRRFQWWGWLSTIGGYISGNGYVWPFVSPAWKAHLDTQGSRDMARMHAFIRSVPWYQMVPSGLAGMKTLVTAGGGSISLDNYVSAAATPAGTSLVAYLGPGHTGSVTIDMTAMSGSTRARWYDPTNAAYTTISGSPFPNTGTRSFTPPGSNSVGQADWVLVLDLSGGGDTFPPTAPTNLSASAASSSQINLSWTASTDNTGVAGYRIFRAGSQVGTSSTTTYADTGLAASTTYGYTVAAYDAAGNVSSQSQPASATTSAGGGSDTTPPSTPTNLSSSTVTSTSATILWSASTDNVGVSGYRIFRNSTQIGTSTQTSYTDGGLSPSMAYTYTVSAYDAANNTSPQSQGLVVTTNAGSSTPITFVQLKESRASTNADSISTGTFASAIGGAHLMVVWVWYDSSTQSVTTVTDTAGNAYVRAVGPTTGTGMMAAWRQEIWYAKNTAGASGVSVKATFSGTFNAEKAITAHEYAGADTTAPLDQTAAAAVSGSNVSSGAKTTSSPNELIFGATLFQASGSSGSGFTRRSSIANNVSEDKVVTSTGSYAATFTNSSQSAIAQMATFKAASTSSSSVQAMSMSAIAAEPASPLSVTPRTSVLTPPLTQQFAASGGSGTAVQWTVDGVAGGNATSGTITAGGLYTPPGSAGQHVVSAADQEQAASATVHVTTHPGVFTHHNDNLRTGQNAEETVLTPTNVSASTFGKLFTYLLDGAAFASPLYVAGVSVPGQGIRNVVYVATEHDSVYAFDADGASQNALWQRSFLAAGITPVPADETGDCCGLGPEIGITGTPVIDATTRTLYVVAKTKEVAGSTTSYVQRLHALDLATGAEKFGGPVVIQASVPGQGSGAIAGQVAFDPLHANQRAALLLNRGVVSIAFGAHGDQQTAHGWLIGYDAGTLHRVMALNFSADADGAGIWQANAGLAADAGGNLYAITGDGAFDANTGGRDFGDSVVKIGADGTIADYFTPWNQGALNANGLDLGSAGPLLLPDQPGAHPHLLVSAGKNGTIYLVDRDAMGRFSGTTTDAQIVQALPGIFAAGTPEPGNFSAPVFFNGVVYFSPVADAIQTFPLRNGQLDTGAGQRTAETFAYPGATLAISAAGASQGILWALQRQGTCGVPASCGSAAPAVLRAYDATNLQTLLYSSDQTGSRDALDAAAKFSVPLVANGKVFVSSTTQLSIFGLLP